MHMTLAPPIRTPGVPQALGYLRMARDRIGKQPDIDNSERSITAELKKYALARPPFCFAELELATPDSGVAERQDFQSDTGLYNDEIE